MKDVYYSDYSQYEHDPPGHTCGLPCCREDQNLHIKSRTSGYSCIPAYEKVLEANFTFRKKRVGFIQGRPTFRNTFYSLQHRHSVYRHRMPIPVFRNQDNTKGSPKTRGKSVYDGTKILLSGCLEYPYVLTSRPVIQTGEHIYRGAICLPDSSSTTSRRFRFHDHDPGESLDFESEDDSTVEYYTTVHQNLIRVNTAPLKVVEMSIKSADDVETDGHDNQGFTKDEDSGESILPLEHYYDVLIPGPRKPHIVNSFQYICPDLGIIKEESETETFAYFRKMYINTLARKREKEAAKVDISSQMAETFDGLPQENSVSLIEDVDTNSTSFCHQTDSFSDNYYEDIEIRIENLDISVSDGSAEPEGTFRSFGYNGGKSPVKFRQIREADDSQALPKRQDSFKDNPITLIL